MRRRSINCAKEKKKTFLLMKSHRIRFNVLIVSSKWENICSVCVEGRIINDDGEHVIKNIIEVLIKKCTERKVYISCAALVRSSLLVAGQTQTLLACFRTAQ